VTTATLEAPAPPLDLSRLSRDERVALASLLEERARRKSQRKILGYYPDNGPLRRELYPRHVEFFRLGHTYRVRGMLKGNRVGGTDAGSFEVACHLTGKYPAWWQGRRFDSPITCWIAGDTAKTVRDIIQKKLLGAPDARGTGMLLGDHLGRVLPWSGVPDAVEIAYVKHVTGDWSRVSFKSYDQGPSAYYGDAVHVVWLDEEADALIRGECVKRLATTGGLLLETFTPLHGTTKIIEGYRWSLSAENDLGVTTEGDRAILRIPWRDQHGRDMAPHLSEDSRRVILAENLPHLHAAIRDGIPSLGSGSIYPVPEPDIVVPDFPIPPHWRCGYGMDVGWNRTAAIWAAIDPTSATTYLVSEHYRSQAEPEVHAAAIKARGAWMRGVIDPAANHRSSKDGEQLLKQYRDLGLNLTPAANAVQTGLQAVWGLLSSGRLKVFRSCTNWFEEFRRYHRNEKGEVVKEHDHLMDATRYFVMTGRDLAGTKPAPHAGVRRGSSLVI